jgi:hypothetical protein
VEIRFVLVGKLARQSDVWDKGAIRLARAYSLTFMHAAFSVQPVQRSYNAMLITFWCFVSARGLATVRYLYFHLGEFP